MWLSVALIGAGLLVSTAAAQDGRDPAPVPGCVVSGYQKVNVRSGPAARYGAWHAAPGQKLPLAGVLGDWCRDRPK
jgi:uncharacterized protein YraI